MNDFLQNELGKLFIALLIGAIIGAEREYRTKSAGFRTVILITVGSCLFTMISNLMSNDARVASNIVTGIGFLGAGAIFKEGANIKGLTTATTIWISCYRYDCRYWTIYFRFYIISDCNACIARLFLASSLD